MSSPTADAERIITIDVPVIPEETQMNPDFFQQRLMANLDRHSNNATTFEKALEFDYLSKQGFRDANAARIVMEAGSGRTRAETNNPGNTAAPGGKE